MAFSSQTFNKLQDDDLITALARRKADEEGKLAILKAQEDMTQNRSLERSRQDNAETNKVYREGSIAERQRATESAQYERASEKEKRDFDLGEQRRQVAELQKLAADESQPPEMRQLAQARLAGIQGALPKTGNKPVFRLGRGPKDEPRQVGEIPVDAVLQTDPAVPHVNVTMPGTNLKPSEFRATVADLHRQYEADTKDYQKVLGTARTMRSSFDNYIAKGGRRDPAGQAVLVSFQKALDPTSVVRESEYARSEQGQPFTQRMLGAWQAFVNGGPGVTDDALRAYVEAAEAWAEDGRKYYDMKKQRIKDNADYYKIPLHFIVPNDPTPAAAPPAANKPAAAPGAKPKFELVP